MYFCPACILSSTQRYKCKFSQNQVTEGKKRFRGTVELLLKTYAIGGRNTIGGEKHVRPFPVFCCFRKKVIISTAGKKSKYQKVKQNVLDIPQILLKKILR